MSKMIQGDFGGNYVFICENGKTVEREMHDTGYLGTGATTALETLTGVDVFWYEPDRDDSGALIGAKPGERRDGTWWMRPSGTLIRDEA